MHNLKVLITFAVGVAVGPFTPGVVVHRGGAEQFAIVCWNGGAAGNQGIFLPDSTGGENLGWLMGEQAEA